jgi:hypothetical protein
MCLLPDRYWLVVRIAVRIAILLENTFKVQIQDCMMIPTSKNTPSKHSKVSIHMQICPEIFGSRSLDVLSGGSEWPVDGEVHNCVQPPVISKFAQLFPPTGPSNHKRDHCISGFSTISIDESPLGDCDMPDEIFISSNIALEAVQI